jgi:hypothetical protein
MRRILGYIWRRWLLFGPMSLKHRVWVGLKRILVPFDPFWFTGTLKFVKQILAPRIIYASDFL